MQNNGTIYLHVFFTEAGRSPDPSHKETYSKRRTFSTSKSNLISSVDFRTNPLSSFPFLYLIISNEADFQTYSILVISSSFLCS